MHMNTAFGQANSCKPKCQELQWSSSSVEFTKASCITSVMSVWLISWGSVANRGEDIEGWHIGHGGNISATSFLASVWQIEPCDTGIGTKGSIFCGVGFCKMGDENENMGEPFLLQQKESKTGSGKE